MFLSIVNLACLYLVAKCVTNVYKIKRECINLSLSPADELTGIKIFICQPLNPVRHKRV